jgi:hypothetical protein
MAECAHCPRAEAPLSAISEFCRRAFLAALVLSLGAPAAGSAQTPAGTDPAAAAPESISLTGTARLLAGIDPDDGNARVAQITAGSAWQQHRKAARWGDRSLRTRLGKMNEWQARVLGETTAGQTLVYPFSGPDFINAYALFPNADTYVFFSLEPPGEVPRLADMDDARQAQFYADLRSALNDLVALNFFITPNMKENLQTDALQGTVPLLMAMMGLLELRVDAVEPFDPWPERTQKYLAPGAHRPALLAQGVRIVFENPRTGRSQVLLYLSIDVSDGELRRYPDFLTWLHEFPHPAVLLKSASYLLHGEHFRKLRAALLADSDFIVQDDTGLPYHLVREAGYSVALFGQYEKPVKLFEERYQADLEDAYRAAGNTESLPFPFGYNWRENNKSGVLVARRPPPPEPAKNPPPTAAQ